MLKAERLISVAPSDVNSSKGKDCGSEGNVHSSEGDVCSSKRDFHGSEVEVCRSQHASADHSVASDICSSEDITSIAQMLKFICSSGNEAHSSFSDEISAVNKIKNCLVE
jgi:hypothetical protein